MLHIKKNIYIVAVIALFFSSCEITKRRYLDGWYVSKGPVVYGLTNLEINERGLVNTQKEHVIDQANSILEVKTPEKDSLIEAETIEKELNFSSVRELNIKKQPLFRNKLEVEIDTASEQNQTKSGYNNKAFLAGEYTSFGVSALCVSLGFFAIGNFVTLAIFLFATAIVLFLVSIFLSQIAIRRIRELKLDYKILPHAIITGATLSVFCFVISAIVAIITSLIVANPAIAIVAGLITFILLLILSLSKI